MSSPPHLHLSALPLELRELVCTQLSHTSPLRMNSDRPSYSDLDALSRTSKDWRELAQRALWKRVNLCSEDDARRWLESPLQERGWPTEVLALRVRAFPLLRSLLKMVEGVKDLALLEDKAHWLSSHTVSVDLTLLSMGSLRDLRTLELAAGSDDPPPPPDTIAFPFRLYRYIPHHLGNGISLPSWVTKELVRAAGASLRRLDTSLACFDSESPPIKDDYCQRSWARLWDHFLPIALQLESVDYGDMLEIDNAELSLQQCPRLREMGIVWEDFMQVEWLKGLPTSLRLLRVSIERGIARGHGLDMTRLLDTSRSTIQRLQCEQECYMVEWESAPWGGRWCGECGGIQQLVLELEARAIRVELVITA